MERAVSEVAWEDLGLRGPAGGWGRQCWAQGQSLRRAGKCLPGQDRPLFSPSHAGCHDVLGTGLGGHSGDEARSCPVRRGRASRDAGRSSGLSRDRQEGRCPDAGGAHAFEGGACTSGGEEGLAMAAQAQGGQGWSGPGALRAQPLLVRAQPAFVFTKPSRP